MSHFEALFAKHYSLSLRDSNRIKQKSISYLLAVGVKVTISQGSHGGFFFSFLQMKDSILRLTKMKKIEKMRKIKKNEEKNKNYHNFKSNCADSVSVQKPHPSCTHRA